MGRMTVSVTGIKEMNQALRGIDKGAPKMTKDALNGCADFLIGKAQPLIPTRTGRARRSLKKRASRTEVRIAVGGRAAPYYPWLDFGGRTGINGSVQRRFLSEGRYLYPTLRKHRQEFTAIMEGALEDVARRAGLDVD